MTIADMVKKWARELPVEERKQIVMDILDSLTETTLAEERHTLLELEGLGADVWAGVDPAEYVDALRREWDERP